MGLDGISINQLRIVPENNSSELNNSVRFSTEGSHKIVDGLSSGQKVDPDGENKHENQELTEQYFSDENEDSNEVEEEIIKLDLSKTDKYGLKIDNDTNTILIYEKSSNNVVQKIDARELSSYVGYLSSAQGSLVNRKF